MQRQRGFTLIELMIVIAIIAILATLGVTNFSSALRRARDAKRQSDIVAVQKALETCNDVVSGKYISDADKALDAAAGAAAIPGSGGASIPGFDGIVSIMKLKGCLNETIKPSLAGYDYYGYVTNTSPQRFLLCAEMENYSGNYQFGTPGGDRYNTPPVDLTSTNPTVNETSVISGDACSPTVTKCNAFCVTNSQ